MRSSSKRVILVCKECGERIVLGGPRSVWYSQSTRFRCECGTGLTLADRLDQERSRTAEDATGRPKRPSVLSTRW